MYILKRKDNFLDFAQYVAVEVIPLEQRIQIDINDIQIITKKREADVFSYTCEHRVADGFVYFIRGNGSFTESDGTVYPITDSTVVLLRRGDSYRFYADAGCEYITSAYRISEDATSSLSLLPRTFIADKLTELSLEQINREWQMLRPDSFMMCRLKLLSWYMHLISDASRRSRPCDPAVAKALDFIHKNFKRSFSSSELAVFCSQSISHLRVKFRREVGMSILAYRDMLRIRLSREMLSSRLFSIKETAYELGYADVFHFTKVFKAAVGMPPARFVRETTI